MHYEMSLSLRPNQQVQARLTRALADLLSVSATNAGIFSKDKVSQLSAPFPTLEAYCQNLLGKKVVFSEDPNGESPECHVKQTRKDRNIKIRYPKSPYLAFRVFKSSDPDPDGLVPISQRYQKHFAVRLKDGWYVAKAFAGGGHVTKEDSGISNYKINLFPGPPSGPPQVVLSYTSFDFFARLLGGYNLDTFQGAHDACTVDFDNVEELLIVGIGKSGKPSMVTLPVAITHEGCIYDNSSADDPSAQPG